MTSSEFSLLQPLRKARPGGALLWPFRSRIMLRLFPLSLPLMIAACTQPRPPEAAQPGLRAAPSCSARSNAAAPENLAINPESARLEPHIYPLIDEVHRLPSFSALWVDHWPRWHVVVAFTQPPPLRDIQRLAPAEIRDQVSICIAKRTAPEIMAASDRMATALRRDRSPWSGGYNAKTQRFEITVAKAEDVERARLLLPPDIRADAEIRVGDQPVLQR